MEKTTKKLIIIFAVVFILISVSIFSYVVYLIATYTGPVYPYRYSISIDPKASGEYNITIPVLISEGTIKKDFDNKFIKSINQYNGVGSIELINTTYGEALYIECSGPFHFTSFFNTSSVGYNWRISHRYNDENEGKSFDGEYYIKYFSESNFSSEISINLIWGDISFQKNGQISGTVNSVGWQLIPGDEGFVLSD